jgi:peptidoglycan/LPS O-acetylase OafA/YrhL
MWVARHLFVVLILNKTIALAVTIGLAVLSYRFFESPFLRLKQRVTFVESRGI